MANPAGRPPGLLIHSEAFEAIAAARGFTKRQVALDADISASFVSDLLAHRAGCANAVADRIASTLGVKVGALFPEAAGWVAPRHDRGAVREAVA